MANIPKYFAEWQNIQYLQNISKSYNSITDFFNFQCRETKFESKPLYNSNSKLQNCKNIEMQKAKTCKFKKIQQNFYPNP